MRETKSPPLSQAGSAPFTREEEARRDLGSTRIQRGGGATISTGFLLLLCAGLFAGWLRRAPGGGEDSPALLAGLLRRSAPATAGPSSPGRSLWGLGDLGDLGAWLPTPAATRAVEKTLEERSALSGALRAGVQSFLTQRFRAGNEQVLTGAGGWLFFRKDVDYVNGRSFLNKEVQRARAMRDGISADVVGTIEEFHRYLASRGIRLVLLPVPVKPCLEGHRFSSPGLGDVPRVLHNEGFAGFVDVLKARGVDVFDPSALLLRRLLEKGEPQYLETDTHWTPAAMEAVAQALARHLGPVQSQGAVAPRPSEAVSVSAHGDTLALLGLPSDQTLFQKQHVSIHPVHAGGGLWKPSPSAEVLLLGDSFSNIYSLAPMGWGEGAGFAEHLSAALGGPLDAILRNSDGAFATRQTLQRELAAGRDRLREKKVVVWEFAVRELTHGDWRPLAMELGNTSRGAFYSPSAGAPRRIEGTVAGISPIPRPGAVPYREHVVTLHLVDVKVEGAPASAGRECLVYTWSMREQALTEAARLRPGDSVVIEAQSWEEVSAAKEKFQRSELDDPALVAEPYCWSDAVSRANFSDGAGKP